ncbi:unnamed protein product [Callosobruchus maculatus]|uniref:Uncharacterized protein n=1 Tax=Callosobruchus maculatus TaxID=64391 RepID=A0A653DGH4_CALMS|nr:unnamed protein product [Callosobruchus maculatus]
MCTKALLKCQDNIQEFLTIFDISERAAIGD